MNAPAEHKQQMDLVRERFTRTAGAFADFVLSQRTGEAQRLATLLSPQGRERALDLACGPGTLSLVFAPRVATICGLDLTPAMLLRARQAAAEEPLSNFEAACGNALAMPFADRTFDLVVTSYSMHHLPDAAAAIREVARVLCPGGKFGLLDIIVPENEAHANLNNKIERTRDASHNRTLPVSEFERLLAAAGLHASAEETEEHPRAFDDWMRVAGWKRGDKAYEEVRRLLEGSLPGDTAGFRPLALAAPPKDAADSRPDIELHQRVAYFVAEKK